MKRKILSAAVASVMLTGWCGVASAEKCKDVTVKVENYFKHAGNTPQIKVVDFDYWDNVDAKWREESGVPNIVVNYGRTRTVDKRNLEYVGGQKGTRVRIQYKYMSASSGNWSETLNAESAAFECVADGPNAVTVSVYGI